MEKLTYLTDHQIAMLHEAAYHLNDSGVVAFPTETVMGVGVVYDDQIAYNRLNAVKRRPEDKPYSLMVGSPDQIELFAIVDERTEKIANAFLPGPLTMLLTARKDVPTWVTHGGPVIGIRVPNDPITEQLLQFVGKPLLAPSANHSGEKPAMDSDEVKGIFKDELDYIVEGKALGGVPSTIIDLTGEEIKVVRQGPITIEMINAVLYGNEKPVIAIGNDHAGFEYKKKIFDYLQSKGYKIIDVGSDNGDSVDYPIYGERVGDLVKTGQADFGVVICATGEGIAMAANKVKGVRAGIAYSDEATVLMREHNNANVVAFGAKLMSLPDVLKRIDIFLSTKFENGERHSRRVSELNKIN